MNQSEHATEIEALTHEVKKLNRNFSGYASFVRGMATGFGTAVGAGFLVAIVAVVLERLTPLPILGQLFTFLIGTLTGK